MIFYDLVTGNKVESLVQRPQLEESHTDCLPNKTAIYIDICTHIYTLTYECAYIHTNVCIHIYTHPTYVYTYVYTSHIYVYTQKYL